MERMKRGRRPPPPLLPDPAGDPDLGPNVRASFLLESSRGRFEAPPEGLHPDLRKALAAAGMERLYGHQAEGLSRLLEGRNLIVATPTASGKSLVYFLYALHRWLQDPSFGALFVYPFKALAQDQLAKVNELADRLGFPEFRAAVYDGDTPASRRQKIQKAPPAVLITNPDMLHLAFMAYAENWRDYFARVGLVTFDEAHVYRGIFGANVHHLIWRMERILAAAGARPQWAATSATLADPEGFFAALTRQGAACIVESGAPRPERRLYLMAASGSPYTLACEVMHRLLSEGARTLTFTKARRITELIYSWLVQRDPGYRASVSSYRAGFLPSERRRIEQAFFDGSLMGVVSTSAMEVGIDVGGLDACILVGYPGSLISLFQRMGRVGRGERDASIFLIAMPDALDQYFVQHPDALLSRPLESLVLDPDNAHLIPSHLLCAAREEPLADDQIPGSGPWRAAVEALDRSGELVLDAGGTRWHTLRRHPHRELNLRGIGESYRIVGPSGKAVGTIDGHRVHRECHEGAVYLHQGQTYVVQKVSAKDRKVMVRAARVDYFTEVRSEKDTQILEVLESRKVGPAALSLGRLKVTERTTGFVKKRLAGGEIIAEEPLEAPPLIFETEGFWVAFPEGMPGLLVSEGLSLMGGIHAFEHALIGIFPLLAMADRWDLGGISFPHHPQVAGSAVFVYDGYPGGVGLSRKGFETFERLLAATASAVGDCPCESGCPGCIQSPKCGNGNKPLDKAAALKVIGVLEGKEDLAAAAGETKPAASAAPPAPRKARPRTGRLVFDLETQRLAADVGGWGNIRAMGLALAVTWDLDGGSWRTYFEEEVGDLVQDLMASPLVVGFNVDRFDLEVLRPYCKEDLRAVKTLDLLAVLKARTGFRLSLASLAEANFGEPKSADGLQSVAWYREGRFDLIEAYCRKDVELTGRLYLKGLEEGYVLIQSRTGERLRVNVRGWEV